MAHGVGQKHAHRVTLRDYVWFSTLIVFRLDRGFCNPARCLRTLSLSRLDGELGARKAKKEHVPIIASSSQPVFWFDLMRAKRGVK